MQCHAPHPLNPSASLLAGGAHLALFTLSLEVGRLLHRSPGGAFPNFRTDNSQSADIESAKSPRTYSTIEKEPEW